MTDDERAKLTDLITDGKIRAITFDLEISTDNVKFSGWLSTLSTGAIALVIANLSKVLEKPLLNHAFAFLICGVILIGVSIVTAAVMNWQFNVNCSIKRQMMTLLIKQRIEIVAGEVESEDAMEFGNRLLNAEHLVAGTDRENWKKLNDMNKKTGRYIGKEILAIQQGLTGFGFLLVFLAALRH